MVKSGCFCTKGNFPRNTGSRADIGIRLVELYNVALKTVVVFLLSSVQWNPRDPEGQQLVKRHLSVVTQNKVLYNARGMMSK